MKITTNDLVKVLYGKDAGKQGKVLRVMPKEGKIIVEGVNMYKKHFKGDGKKQQSEIVDIVKPLDIAKVMLICPSCQKPTRTGIERSAKGIKTRVCKKCGKNVDKVSSDSSEKVTEKKSDTKKKTTSKKKTKQK